MLRKILVLFAIIISISLNINAQDLKLLDAKDAVTGASSCSNYRKSEQHYGQRHASR